MRSIEVQTFQTFRTPHPTLNLGDVLTLGDQPTRPRQAVFLEGVSELGRESKP